MSAELETEVRDSREAGQASIETFLGMPCVFASPPMRDLIEAARRAARISAAVLITGESGSGKEIIARAIHHYSLRSKKPWVDISCGAMPDHLMESELFGYEKGAFSGAESLKPGLFELADTGSIFLDEIAELDPRMQVKLLRVLDGVPYYRLGGTRKVSVDSRVIAATNQDLGTAIQEGRFRRDLYYRLSQIHLRVPPLRERREDILPLADYFLRQQNPELRFSPAACDLLRLHSWPGNVRELRNVVIKAAVFAPGDRVEGEAIFLDAGRPREDRTIEGMERRMIFDVLEKTNGHQAKAADLLGISVRTLSRKLKSYTQSEWSA